MLSYKYGGAHKIIHLLTLDSFNMLLRVIVGSSSVCDGYIYYPLTCVGLIANSERYFSVWSRCIVTWRSHWSAVWHKWSCWAMTFYKILHEQSLTDAFCFPDREPRIGYRQLSSSKCAPFHRNLSGSTIFIKNLSSGPYLKFWPMECDSENSLVIPQVVRLTMFGRLTPQLMLISKGRAITAVQNCP